MQNNFQDFSGVFVLFFYPLDDWMDGWIDFHIYIYIFLFLKLIILILSFT